MALEQESLLQSHAQGWGYSCCLVLKCIYFVIVRDLQESGEEAVQRAAADPSPAAHSRVTFVQTERCRRSPTGSPSLDLGGTRFPVNATVMGEMPPHSPPSAFSSSC